MTLTNDNTNLIQIENTLGFISSVLDLKICSWNIEGLQRNKNDSSFQSFCKKN